MSNQKKIAILQGVILVVAIFAFTWIIGSSVEFVSASGDETCASQGGTCVPAYSCQDGGLTNFNSECSPNICCKNLKETVEPPEDEDNGITLEEVIDTSADVIGTYEAGKSTWNWISGKSKEKAAEEITKKGFGKWIKNNIKLFKTAETYVGQIASNALFAATTAIILIQISKKFASERNLADIETVVWVGAGTGISIVALGIIGGPPGWVASAVTAVFYGAYMLVGYQIYSRETFTFYPGLWQPIDGGDNCEECNKLKLPNGESGCSEYMCHSYGKACGWINNETDYETCIELNPNDRLPPEITAVEKAYGESVFPRTDNDKYSYETSIAGAKIVYSGKSGTKCVPAFSSITIAVETDEEAHCRIALESGPRNAERFDEMIDMAEGTVSTKIHTLTIPNIATASDEALEGIGYLRNDEPYEFYIRCKDVQGNVNEQDYLVSFCVQEGPDTSPPEIDNYDSPNIFKDEGNSYVQYGISTIEDFRVYTNEPVHCKWDFERKSYDSMNYEFEGCTETIQDSILGQDGNGAYGCKGNLDGFVNEQTNKYYIACIDKSERKNAMDPEEIILIGTSPLSIQKITMNGKNNGTTIKDSTNRINVKLEIETFGGVNSGKARCQYRKKGSSSWALFNNNGNRNYVYPNTHNLYLENGTYEYEILCSDAARNKDLSFINFKVESDTTPPVIVRAFRETGIFGGGDYLAIVTNENAECFYSNFGCNYEFEEGTPMTTLDGTTHYADWNIESDFYIRCRDEFGTPHNTANTGSGCGIIVRPFEIFEPLE